MDCRPVIPFSPLTSVILMSEFMPIPVSRLQTGSVLTNPIHDLGGVLLLQKDASITEEVKRKLLLRGISSVVVSQTDFENCSVTNSSSLNELEFKLDKQLNDLIASGAMSIRRKGPAVLENLKGGQSSSYDNKQFEEIRDWHSEQARRTGEAFQKAAGHIELDVRNLSAVSRAIVEQIIEEMDATLASILSIGNNDSHALRSLQLATLSIAIGVHMNHDMETLKLIGLSAILSDVGLLLIGNDPLRSSHPLSKAEYVEYKKHPIYSANILEKHAKSIPAIIQMIAYQVHEQCDGSGFPRGRKKDRILPQARLINVAENYFSLTSPPVFRRCVAPYIAVRMLLSRASAGKVDREPVRALLKAISLFPIGSVVQLSDQRMAKVIRANPDDYCHPVVCPISSVNGDVDGVDQLQEPIDLSVSSLKIMQALRG